MVERANKNDISTLTELRLAYLQEDSGEMDKEVIQRLRVDLPIYFHKHLNQEIFCYFIREDSEIAACAFLLVVEKPASPMFLTGRTGTLLNVYTKPAFRHKGYAKKIMTTLLSDAAEMGLSTVELKSTDAGYHLYKSVGFSDDLSKYHRLKWDNIR